MRFAATLGLSNTNPVLSPIDVFQAKPHHFAATDAVSRQQHQYCVIPQCCWSPIGAHRVEQLSNLFFCERPRNFGKCIDRWSRYESKQIPADPCFRSEISQKTPHA